MRVRFLTVWKLFFDTLSSAPAGFQNDFASYERKNKRKEFKKHRNSLVSYPLHTLSPKLTSGCCRKSQWLSWGSFLSSSQHTQTVPSDQLPPQTLWHLLLDHESVKTYHSDLDPLLWFGAWLFPRWWAKLQRLVMAVSSLLWTPLSHHQWDGTWSFPATNSIMAPFLSMT